MDELLASIREIIEENAGVSSYDGGRQAAENGNRGSVKTDMHMQPHYASNDTGDANLKQDIRLTARNNGIPPVQDAMNALAERIGLRKVPMPGQPEGMVRPVMQAPMPGQPEGMVKPAMQAPMSSHQSNPQRMAVVRDGKPEAPRVSVKSQQQQSKQKRSSVQDVDEGFRNDVERSAELLLRPYISQWLDDHFRQLFERILREEVQRFIQALRR